MLSHAKYIEDLIFALVRPQLLRQPRQSNMSKSLRLIIETIVNQDEIVDVEQDFSLHEMDKKNVAINIV